MRLESIIIGFKQVSNMIFRYRRAENDIEMQRKRYRQIGRDAFQSGLDRSVADDFGVQYRAYVRAGWDEADANNLFRIVESLNISGPTTKTPKRKFSV